MKKLIPFIILLFSSILANAQWQSNNFDSVQITCIHADNYRVFVGTKGGVYISNNNGNSFAYSPMNPSIYNVHSIASNGTTIFAGTLNGLRKSVDSGLTWVGVPTLTNFTVWSVVAYGNLIYTASALGVHISTDNGVSWSIINNGLPTLQDSYKVIAYGTNIFTLADSMVFLSTNNGALFDTANTGLQNNSVLTLAMNGSTIFAGTNNGVFVSTNNGNLWTASNIGLPNSRVYSLTINGTTIYAATDSGVYISNNNGSLWNAFNTGLPNMSVKHLANNGSTIYAALSTQTSSGELWHHSSSTASIDNINNYDFFELYPNPSTGKFRIKGDVVKFNQIEIYNLFGQRVFQTLNQNQVLSNEIDLTGFSKGIYFLNLTGEERSYTRKILIQ